MGTYSYSEHLDTFGGPPEPGEAFPGMDAVDALRKAQKEDCCPRCHGDGVVGVNGSWCLDPREECSVRCPDCEGSSPAHGTEGENGA